MPYAMKANKDGTYRVVNTDTGEVHARKASKANAERQMRLLYGVDHGMKVRNK